MSPLQRGVHRRTRSISPDSPADRVNPTLCTGYGYCADIVPELISVDDWGYPIVNPKPIDGDGLLSLAKRAVATCPRLALVIEEQIQAGS